MRFTTALVLILMVASVLTTSCGTVPKVTEGKVQVKDTEGNDYLTSYKDNSETKTFEALVDVKGKTYYCKVDYTKASPDAMGFGINVNALELTGKVEFTYKDVTVECSVADDVLTEADKKEIEAASEAESVQ